jgi:hypothetical protein
LCCRIVAAVALFDALPIAVVNEARCSVGDDPREAAVGDHLANAAVEGVIVVLADQHVARFLTDFLEPIEGVPLVGANAIVGQIAVAGPGHPVIAEWHIPAAVVDGGDLVQPVVLAQFVHLAATDRRVHGAVPVPQAVQVVGSLSIGAGQADQRDVAVVVHQLSHATISIIQRAGGDRNAAVGQERAIRLRRGVLRTHVVTQVETAFLVIASNHPDMDGPVKELTKNNSGFSC